MARPKTTRCRSWFELNLAALNFREMRRASGIFSAMIGLALFRVPGLFGVRWPGGMVFPGEVTVVWDVDADELDEPDEVSDLGFKPLGAFELPEFSGVNDTLLMCDRDRKTYCEVIYVRAQGTTSYGNAFSSLLAGEPYRGLKTVQNWRASPLDRPDGYPCQCVRGSLEDVYEAHRNWVDSFGESVVPTTMSTFLEASHRSHVELMNHWINRKLYIEARPHLVRQLLRVKGLKQQDREQRST